MAYESLYNSRIVLSCNNNLSFAGTMKGTIAQGDKQYVMVETDEASGFCILCPHEFIKEIFAVPIQPCSEKR